MAIKYKTSTHPEQTPIRVFETEDKKMAKLSEEAKNYEPPTTKNIAELNEVSVNMEVKEKTVDNNGDPFSYKYVEVDDEEYRMPTSVIKQVKTHLEENPKMQLFKVRKEGEGLKTVYTVIPL